MSRPAVAVALPPDWYRYVVAEGVTDAKPGLYEWRIAYPDGRPDAVYIGKFTSKNRPTKEYGYSLRRMLGGQAHHKRGLDYRRIHHALHRAHVEAHPITLTIIENVVDKLARNRRELELARQRGTLNGPAGPVSETTGLLEARIVILTAALRGLKIVVEGGDAVQTAAALAVAGKLLDGKGPAP